LWIALIIAGISIAGVVGILVLRPWKRAPSDTAAAPPPPNPGTGKVSPSGPAVQPPAPGGAPDAVPVATFEEAFREGRISWRPVKYLWLTNKIGDEYKSEIFEFPLKLKYDEAGRASPDTTGQRKYAWPDREAVFAPGAVIRLTRDATVREGALHAGAEWTWTGQQWQAFTGTSLGTTPSNNPAAEWARRTAMRLDSRKLVTVDARRRLTAFTKTPNAGDTVKEWRAALDQATGQQVEFLALTIFISQFGQLWKGEEFLSAESQKYVARLKQLTKEGVVTWRDDFRNVTVDRMEDLNAALALSQMDYLYEGEMFRAEKAVRLLPRLRSLNAKMLQPWADALEGSTLEAAIEIIDQDWLFEGDQLKASASEEALAALQAARSGPKK